MQGLALMRHGSPEEIKGQEQFDRLPEESEPKGLRHRVVTCRPEVAVHHSNIARQTRFDQIAIRPQRPPTIIEQSARAELALQAAAHGRAARFGKMDG